MFTPITSAAAIGAAGHQVVGKVKLLTVAEARYQRERDLPGLLHLWPDEAERFRAGDTKWLVSYLEQALAGERRRGLEGRWPYDQARHAGLLRALKYERARLERERSEIPPPRMSSLPSTPLHASSKG